MPNYKLVESWGKPNDQNREWLAQTEEDKTTLLIEQEFHFGDKIQVVDPPKKYVIGKDGVAYDADEDEGGSTVRLQSKSVIITENGENTITYDSGYDGLSSVGVDVNVEPSLQTKSVTYSSNGEHTVTYDNDYDGLASVGVTVDVSPTLQSKSVKYTTNGNNTVTYDNGYDGLSAVGIEVDVDPTLQAKSVTYTSNGEHTITYDSGYDGLSTVNVGVNVQPILQNKTITCASNQTRTVSVDSGYDGMRQVSITVDVPSGVPGAPEDAVIFYSLDWFTIQTHNNQKNWNGILYYSTDYTTWNEWDGVSAIASAKTNGWHKLYIRGVNNTQLTGGLANYRSGYWEFYGNVVKCVGNLNNLLNYNGAVSMLAYAFAYLFAFQSSISFDVQLPSTTLTKGCYLGTFLDCKSLTTAPILPATIISDECYRFMFSGCRSLITAPALPATTLTSYCYASMFSGCTSLTTAPILPATTLANYCYDSMFSGCHSLTSAPALPATTLANYCYNQMFYNCTSLTKIPSLPATTLKTCCYYYMFYLCLSLKLSTTQTGEYQNAYRIPTSGTGTVGSDSLTSMFDTTGGTFTGTPEINTTYYTSNAVISAE